MYLEIKVISGDLTKIRASALIVNIPEGAQHPAGATATIDEALGGTIPKLIAEGEIKGKLNEITIIHTLGKIEPERVVVVGLGKQQELTLDKIRGVAAEACRSLRKIGAETIATVAHRGGRGGFDPEKAAQAVVEGSILGLYEFREHIGWDS